MYSVQSFSRSCASSLPGIPHFSNKLPDNKAKRLFTMKGFQADKSLNVEEPLASNVSSEKHTNICKNLRKTCGVIKASAGTDLETTIDEVEKEKSEIYSSNMTTAMGAVLTYRHELGINYNFVLPDLIVGSCLQSAADVDKLRSIGVKTIFCLQQDPDLEYFGVDISSIQDRAKQIGGIQHIRAEIRDFDGFDLRTRLPKVISILRHAIKEGQGITYIHCTAGLGRAPSVTLAYMFWVLGYKLEDASKLLLSVRPCFPKLDAIRCATADMLTKGSKQTVTLKWNSRSCASVQISGLDVGWGQMLPLSFDEQQGYWILKRELPVGFYEYKYVVDGEWTCNKDELKTSPNKDGHVNNYVEVEGDVEDKELRKRLMQDVNLTEKDRILICKKLDALVNED